jgi:hypothetical protein
MARAWEAHAGRGGSRRAEPRISGSKGSIRSSGRAIRRNIRRATGRRSRIIPSRLIQLAALAALVGVLAAGCSSTAPPLITASATPTQASDGAGGSSLSAEYPPAGEIWFGPSVDSRLVLASHFGDVSTETPLVAVAHLTKSMRGSDLSMQSYFNDKSVTTVELEWDGTGEIWSWPPGPLVSPGTWRWELTDVGGTVLAAGEVVGTSH